MLVGELEGLDQSQSFVHRPTHRKVVDGYLAQDALGIDDEQSSERDASLLVQNPIGAGDGHGLVRQDRDAHLPQAALVARGVHPGQVAEVAVRGGRDDGYIDLLELLDAVGEGDDFGRADEGAVKRGIVTRSECRAKTLTSPAGRRTGRRICPGSRRERYP